MIMRRFILVAVLIIISQTALKSQDTDLENNAEVRSQIESIFENIDKSRIMLPTWLIILYLMVH